MLARVLFKPGGCSPAGARRRAAYRLEAGYQASFGPLSLI
jgi:hypothetical protein